MAWAHDNNTPPVSLLFSSFPATHSPFKIQDGGKFTKGKDRNTWRSQLEEIGIAPRNGRA